MLQSRIDTIKDYLVQVSEGLFHQNGTGSAEANSEQENYLRTNIY